MSSFSWLKVLLFLLSNVQVKYFLYIKDLFSITNPNDKSWNNFRLNMGLAKGPFGLSFLKSDVKKKGKSTSVCDIQYVFSKVKSMYSKSNYDKPFGCMDSIQNIRTLRFSALHTICVQNSKWIFDWFLDLWNTEYTHHCVMLWHTSWSSRLNNA